ncbi:MAG: T9SS type A sorting domain-containing protein [bacterium]|nr:T9SS type A sorting domain-containing protein [bacterium]
MYKVLGIIVSLVLCASLCTSQILFEEHFTDGNLTLNWFDGWGVADPPDTMTVVSVTGNPTGDGWVGKLSNAGTVVATALAGNATIKDYSVEAYIYTTVSASGGPYQGIVARWDTTTNYYYLLMCDFDATQRIRLSFNQSATPNTIREWVGDEIPGGVPTEDGWHKLKLVIVGNQIWAYFDDNELPNCPFTYEGTAQGFFGVYVFSMSGVDSILCDDIVVFEATGIEEEIYNSNDILFSIFPVPAIGNVVIDYTLPQKTDVTLKVYNIQGQEITTLYTGYRDAGTYSTVWEKSDLAGGVYFLRLSTDYGEQSRRILLLR